MRRFVFGIPLIAVWLLVVGCGSSTAPQPAATVTVTATPTEPAASPTSGYGVSSGTPTGDASPVAVVGSSVTIGSGSQQIKVRMTAGLFLKHVPFLGMFPGKVGVTYEGKGAYLVLAEHGHCRGRRTASFLASDKRRFSHVRSQNAAQKACNIRRYSRLPRGPRMLLTAALAALLAPAHSPSAGASRAAGPRTARFASLLVAPAGSRAAAARRAT
jgi:hypothetical protein